MGYSETSILRVSALKHQRVDPTSTYYIDFGPFVYRYDVDDGSMPDTAFTGYEMNDILVSPVQMMYKCTDVQIERHSDWLCFLYNHGRLLATVKISSGPEQLLMQVTQKDTEYGFCQAVTDPRITSFDRKYYLVYDIGQFLMWKSSAQRHFEVRGRETHNDWIHHWCLFSF